jgi:hypothetical protein
MENEETIKIENKMNSDKLSAKIFCKINKLILLQIINLFFIFLLLFEIYSSKKNQGKYLYQNYDKNNYTNNYNNKKDDNHLDKLYEKIKLLKIITNNDESEYKGMLKCLIAGDPDSEYCIYHLISPKKVIGKNRILLGKKSYGCYILLDDFENINIAYSFGIGRDIQFDKYLADRGIDVYMYDHTINSLPYQNNKFHWKKVGLCGKNSNRNDMKTLEDLLKENGHSNEKNMILKIDIEKWEWESLDTLNEEILKQFKYIAMEYHFDDESKVNNKIIYYNVLKKISKTHQPFYVRCANNQSQRINFGPNRICYILEVSYIIKEGNLFENDETIYPIYEFDYDIRKKGTLDTNLNILKLFSD